MACTLFYLTELLFPAHSEKNIMFREYLKRLESHKKCQNLSMQSFLLLPMQRITRMPLLILAILNRTPLNHPDHATVEKTLRTVQKVFTKEGGLVYQLTTNQAAQPVSSFAPSWHDSFLDMCRRQRRHSPDS